MGNFCIGMGGGAGGQEEETPSGSGDFKIELEYSGLSEEQKKIFTAAAARWGRVIRADNIAPVNLPNGTRIEGLRIQASGIRIDGTGSVLGRAGPTAVRPSNGIPYSGIMEFDTADLASLQRNGTLDDVILHEMGHVLGVGTLWKTKGLLAGAGTNNPEFTGENAMKEYATLLGESGLKRIPVANTGGPGTREGHWREAVFDEELMTGLAERTDMPMSRMTIASLIDLGYQVDLSAADSYDLPRRAAITGTAPAVKDTRRLCGVTFPEVASSSGRGCLCC